MIAKKDIKAFQSTFKVQIVQKEAAEASAVPLKPFVSRKAHAKSRSGCLRCKKHRIKCNESTPTCERCAKAGVLCIYRDGSALTQRSSGFTNGDRALSVSITSQMHNMAVSAAQTDLESLLSLNNASTDPIRAVPTTIHLLQHFQSAVSSTLGCYDTSRVMQSSVGSIAWDHPYLMHIVLAFSCAHRRRFNIENCLFAEAMHWRDGLQLYRLKLAQLDRGQEEAPWDALVATTFLINMYAFSIDDQGDDLTDPLSDENLNTTFAPMEATGAFRGLFYFFREDKHSDSQWLPILTGTDDSSGKFTCHSPGIEGVQQNLADLCDMNASSTVDNNVYHKIVKSLAPLHTLQPSQENFAIFFAFLGRTWPHFKPLLYRKDPRGLLLFSYWLALLQQVDQWWLRTRTQRLLYTIVAFLWKTEDVQIHALLPSILTSTQ